MPVLEAVNERGGAQGGKFRIGYTPKLTLLVFMQFVVYDFFNVDDFFRYRIEIAYNNLKGRFSFSSSKSPSGLTFLLKISLNDIK